MPGETSSRKGRATMEEQQPAPAGDPQEKTWAMLCHLLALSAYIGVPFGNIAGPLVMWLIKKESSPLVDDQGKEALNFNITVTIYFIVSAVLLLLLIGFLLLIAVAIFHVVLTIMAAVAANRGERYRYPLTIRIVK